MELATHRTSLASPLHENDLPAAALYLTVLAQAMEYLRQEYVEDWFGAWLDHNYIW